MIKLPWWKKRRKEAVGKENLAFMHEIKRP